MKDIEREYFPARNRFYGIKGRLFFIMMFTIISLSVLMLIFFILDNTTILLKEHECIEIKKDIWENTVWKNLGMAKEYPIYIITYHSDTGDLLGISVLEDTGIKDYYSEDIFNNFIDKVGENTYKLYVLCEDCKIIPDKDIEQSYFKEGIFTTVKLYLTEDDYNLIKGED